MALFSLSIKTLKLASQSSVYWFFIPRSLREILYDINLDQPDIELQNRLVSEFLTLKRETYYYHLSKSIPCLKIFEEAISRAIESKCNWSIHSLVSKPSQLNTKPSKSETTLCVFYYLMKANLWSPENVTCINQHRDPNAVLKSIALLDIQQILIQSTFDFVTNSFENPNTTKDIAYLLIALRSKNGLNIQTLREFISIYKFNLGRVLFILCFSENVAHQDTYKLRDKQCSTIRDLANNSSITLYSHASLLQMSNSNICIRPEDIVYFLASKSRKSAIKSIIKCLTEAPQKGTDYFIHNNKCSNQLNDADLEEIRLLSERELNHLSIELSLLKKTLDSFVFHSKFISLLIKRVSNNFISRKQIILFLEEHQCVDPHIIYALYNMQLNNLDPILKTLNKILPLLDNRHKRSMLCFYFMHNAPDLDEVFKLSGIPLDNHLIRASIPLRGMRIIQGIYAKNPKILTQNFLYHLEHLNFIDKMRVFFQYLDEKLPLAQLIDDDLIKFAKHNAEILDLIKRLKSITVSFFRFLIYQTDPTLFKTLRLISPKLDKENLIQQDLIGKLINYIARRLKRGDVPEKLDIILIINQFPPSKLDKSRLERLLNDPEIGWIRCSINQIKQIKSSEQQDATRKKFLALLQTNASSYQIYKALFHRHGTQPELLWSIHQYVQHDNNGDLAAIQPTLK